MKSLGLTSYPILLLPKGELLILAILAAKYLYITKFNAPNIAFPGLTEHTALGPSLNWLRIHKIEIL